MTRLIRDITSERLSPVATLHLDDGTSIEVGRDDIRRILDEVRECCPWCGECANVHDAFEPDPFDDWPDDDEEGD